MRHLNDEALARLVDEPGDADEALHLRDCFVCRRELAELRAQTRALAELADPPLPATAWDRLEARLRAEGLMDAAPRRRLWIPVHGLRAAAAIALFLLGGAAGAALWRPSGPQPLATLPGERATRVAALPAAANPRGVVFGTPASALMSPAPARSGGARLASTAPPHAVPAATLRRAQAPPRARNVEPVRVTRRQAEQAARELVQAQAAYVAALERYTAIADPASGNDAETRMAALDQLIELTGAALERTPGDPVINGYHLAATAERDRLRREQDRASQTDWF